MRKHKHDRPSFIPRKPPDPLRSGLAASEQPDTWAVRDSVDVIDISLGALEVTNRLMDCRRPCD